MHGSLRVIETPGERGCVSAPITPGADATGLASYKLVIALRIGVASKDERMMRGEDA